jgi:hypothetical protein
VRSCSPRLGRFDFLRRSVELDGLDGNDKFSAQDGGIHLVDGGNGSDSMLNKDAADSIVNVP